MKVAALVSGGKDSCYAAMKCSAYGHEIAVLANIEPAAAVDDADSYMYQTVGHSVIGAYAQCFELPLFREKTEGRCKNDALAYTATVGDEVEDLERLLRRVKEGESVAGVCSGAVSKMTSG
mmetsp:Transcript_2686/g.8098  ORF Transcript_2686/g.8098 Transcript_2686/m.8098 type:complete len:121 (-) Transcript_2686:234-596(-)